MDGRNFTWQARYVSLAFTHCEDQRTSEDWCTPCTFPDGPHSLGPA